MVPVLLFNLYFITSCSPSGSKTRKEVFIRQSDIVSKSLEVKGMTCVGCEVTLEENISKIEGVVSVKASHSKDEAIIEFDTTKTDLRSIARKIKESGYKPFTN